MIEANIENYDIPPAHIYSVNQAEGNYEYLKQFGQLPEEFVQANEPDISGGTPTEQGVHPWVVVVRTPEGSATGTLIDDEWILTCAHCVSNGEIPAGSITLNIGGIHKRYAEPGEIFIKGVQVFVHPQYDPLTGDFDFALIKIHKIKESDVVKPIALNTEVEPLTAFDILTSTVVGWGQTPTELSTPILQNAEAQFICRTKEYGRITCKDPYNPTIGICPGNSGSPLEVERNGTKEIYAVGVGGNSCDAEDRFNDFLRVSEVSGWIDETKANNPNRTTFMPQIENKKDRTYMPDIRN